ncbi:LexA-binding, inner membrane-associated putative hydrolase [Ectothiorhodospira magna]|uniref:LexA-binding, inner membrane-associated putative hydrolase n=2 Tax=Ectothiorhodospira magna TaxID=867345 RepID=A0A1H9E8E9_9GAMM|nr:LexA-binding, inner membrane-associated putative hydrolase [Ectothiorhodospira magna]
MAAVAVVSPIAAMGLLPWPDSLVLALFVVMGTLLPDIDVNGGRPQRWLFGTLALAGAILAFHLVADLKVFSLVAVPGQVFTVEAIALAILVWFLIRHPAATLFQKMTRHRGLCHSLVVAALWGLGWVYLGLTWLSTPDLLVWLQGLALFVGFLIHLILDELYSVDINSARIKRSFGSAFKIWEPAFPLGSLLATAALGLLLWQLPYPHELMEWLRVGFLS